MFCHFCLAITLKPEPAFALNLENSQIAAELEPIGLNIVNTVYAKRIRTLVGGAPGIDLESGRPSIEFFQTTFSISF
jgi:hypothetical protein